MPYLPAGQAGITFRRRNGTDFRYHFALESGSHFGIILYWNRLVLDSLPSKGVYWINKGPAGLLKKLKIQLKWAIY